VIAIAIAIMIVPVIPIMIVSGMCSGRRCIMVVPGVRSGRRQEITASEIHKLISFVAQLSPPYVMPDIGVSGPKQAS